MNETILIVDDEPEVLATLDSILSGEGFKVKTAANGRDAIRFIAEHQIDLLITDVRMPGIDGLEVMKRVKQFDSDIEVIILTGFATIENAVSALRDDGAFDYLTKPLDEIDRLINSANQALERRRLRLENRQRTIELEKINEILRLEIAERKKAEHAMQESEERYRSIFEQAADPILLIDPKTGVLLAFNDLAYETQGLNREEFQSLRIQDLDILETSEKITRHIENIFKKGKDSIEARFRSTNGEILDFFVNSKKISFGGKTIIQSIWRDISERKKAEEEKAKLQAQLQQSRKLEAIASLAGGIAHQFNNDLTVLFGGLDWIEIASSENKRLAENLGPMTRSAHHMATLTRQLLAYARGGKYLPRIITVNDFIENTLPIIKTHINPDICVETDLPKAVQDIKADPTQMQMVLSSVIVNANEAINRQGRIRIKTRNQHITPEFTKICPDFRPGDFVRITIEDNGKGMDEETRTRIFEPFFTTKFQGRGLGMAAAYGIIKSHDGWIFVDSQLGKGTMVSIYLPAFESKIRGVNEPKVKTFKNERTIGIIEDVDMVGLM